MSGRSGYDRACRFNAPPISRDGRASVGAALYHTVGDRAEAVKQLVVDMDRAYIDIGHAVGVLPDEGSAERIKNSRHPEWFVWWQAAAAPLFREWATFKAEQLSGDTTGPGGAYIAFANRWQTDWPVYDKWRGRLVQLRNSARKMGIPVTSPEPAELPTTVIEDVEHLAERGAKKAASGIGDVWEMIKWVVYGGLGLVGATAIVSLVNHARAGTDPVQSYSRIPGQLRGRV